MARANRQTIRDGLQQLLEAQGNKTFLISESGPYMRNGYWHCNLDLVSGVPFSSRLHRTIAELDMHINDKFKETITLHLGKVPAESLAERSEQQLMVAESTADYRTS